MPRSLSRLKRWKCAISAYISATYSPFGSFINYICLLPETVHDAALSVPAEEVKVRDIGQHAHSLVVLDHLHISDIDEETILQIPGFQIRIRMGSGFNLVSGSGSVFGILIWIQEGKNGTQK